MYAGCRGGGVVGNLVLKCFFEDVLKMYKKFLFILVFCSLEVVGGGGITFVFANDNGANKKGEIYTAKRCKKREKKRKYHTAILCKL